MPYNDKDVTDTHPSYAMIGFSRVTTNKPENLFGASIKHGTYMTCTIRRANKVRRLSGDNYYAGEEIISIAMTEDQFARAISSPNVGYGAPCTIEHILGERPPACPEVNPRELYEKEFAASVKGVYDGVEGLIKEARELLEMKSPTKANRQVLISKLEALSRDLSSNLPFVQSRFNESVEATIHEARSEVTAHAMEVQARMGMEALVREYLVAIPADQQETHLEAYQKRKSQQ